MRWVRYVAYMGVTIYTDTQLTTEGKSHSTDSGVDHRMIIKWILQNYVVKVWTKKTI